MHTPFSDIQRALKAAIKGKGFTYKKLAPKLKLSEAGLKRLLNARDCSLQRILQICEVIGVSLEDLLVISRDLDVEIQDFTPAQIALFEHSAIHLKYFYKLKVEDLTPAEIECQMQMPPKMSQQILFDLDRLNLIELLPGNRIKRFEKKGVLWKKLAPAMRQFKADFTADLLGYFDRVEGHRGEGYYPIYHLKLTDRSRQELYGDLGTLIDKFVRRCGHEEISQRDNLKPLNIAFVLAPIYGFAAAPRPRKAERILPKAEAAQSTRPRA